MLYKSSSEYICSSSGSAATLISVNFSSVIFLPPIVYRSIRSLTCSFSILSSTINLIPTIDFLLLAEQNMFFMLTLRKQITFICSLTNTIKSSCSYISLLSVIIVSSVMYLTTSSVEQTIL